MTLRAVPVPEPGPGEVRLRVRSVGIDGGVEQLIYDWHESKHHYADDLPQIFGHEFAGVVDAVGSGVETVDGGERVAVEPATVCGACRNCRAGRRSLCESPDRRAVGVDTDHDGALAEYTIVPEETLYVFPADLSFDVGTFLELVGLGVHAVEQSRLRPGDRVAVAGPGSAGLGTLIAARAAGATSAIVIGTEADRETRLPVAAELGADRTLLADDIERGTYEDIDVFFECSGSPTALEDGIRNVRAGGEVVQVGVFHAERRVEVDLNRLVTSGIHLKTVFGRIDSSWHRAIAIAREVDVSPAVGPAFPFENDEAAFGAMRERAGSK